MFASRFRAGYVTSGRDDRYDQVDLWLYYAYESTGRTNYLGERKLVVSYNRWCKDLDYRRDLAEALRLRFSDAGFDEVPRQGGGSSFEGRQLDGKASKMKTEERWKSLASDPRFIACFRNPRVLKLSEEIFGEIDGTREFVRRNVSHWGGLRASLRELYVRYGIMPLIDFRLWQEKGIYISDTTVVGEGSKDEKRSPASQTGLK